jgi:hypothetical protein
MSSILYGAMVAKREAAQPNESTDKEPPGVSSYLDSLAALVPAEVLALHAVILGFCTTKAAGSNGVAEITEPDTLKWAFWALLILSSLLFLFGRQQSAGADTKTAPTKTTLIQALIPPAAFVAWTMLLPASAFDTVDSGLAVGARDTIAVIAAVVLGVVAVRLGYKLNKAPPTKT